MSILMSIKPKWCELIASGKKTIEVRKTRPMLYTPFKVYIYETRERYMPWIDGTMTQEDARAFGVCLKGGGKVIGEFVCDKIIDIYPGYTGNCGDDCLSYNEQEKYLGTGEDGKSNRGYGWHISDLKIYDTPKVLSEFMRPCATPYECEKCEKLVEYFGCAGTIIRAPESWCYVEE